jgi:hypothetical protein
MPINKRDGTNGISFGADFSGLHERPTLKGADLEAATSLEVSVPQEPTAEVVPFVASGPDPLTKLLNEAEHERGLPYTFRIPISMDREFRLLAKEFDLDLSDIARSGLEMALIRLRQMSKSKRASRPQ